MADVDGFCIWAHQPWLLVPEPRRYVIARLDGELVGFVSIVIREILGNPIFSFVGEEEYVASSGETNTKKNPDSQ